MEYLTDKQMKYEKPLKNAYSKENNAFAKFLHQSGQNSTSVKYGNGRELNVYYSPRTNKVIVQT